MPETVTARSTCSNCSLRRVCTTINEHAYCQQCSATLDHAQCAICHCDLIYLHARQARLVGRPGPVSICNACFRQHRRCVSCAHFFMPSASNTAVDYCERCVRSLVMCSHCGNHFASSGGVTVEDADGNDIHYCNRCATGTTTIPDSTFNLNTSHRYVGFELEFLGPESPKIPARGRMKGDASLHEHAGKHCERCTADVIPDTQFGDDYKKAKDRIKQGASMPTYEFAGAKARGDALLEQIIAVTRACRNAGCYVNRTCGFHVHLDVSDLDTTKRRILMYWWRTFEPIFRSMVAPSRRSSIYCKPVAELPDYAWETQRYSTLNISVYNRQKTFEVRLHHGTLNARKIRNWIELLLLFFDKMPNLTPADVGPNIRKLKGRALVQKLWTLLDLPLHLQKDMLNRIKAYSKVNPIIHWPLK